MGVKRVAVMVCGVAFAMLAGPGAAGAQEKPSFTSGRAQTVHEGLRDCGWRSRTSAVGRITSADGKTWTVPAQTNFETAPKATDLYNPCGGERLDRLAELDLDAVPVMDAGGDEVFTAYLFGDNYFELYVNGRLLAVDAVPFTPFNSAVIRFRAARPFTIAVMGVDWEENLGLGSERGRGRDYHPGDAGFVAVIKDAKGKTVAITDKSWRAQTFYTAPLQDRSCLKLVGPIRDTSACSTRGVNNGGNFSAAHWPVLANWSAPDFDDSNWPAATEFTNDTVGVDNKPAFMNFLDVFDDPKRDARFIWSSNLVLDNLVLMRKRVE